MELNEMEKKLLFQVEGDYQTKILNELYMTVRYSNNSEQREAAEGLMAKLRVLSNAECMDLVKDIQKNYCALPGFVDSKNEEKTERNAGYLVVSQSGGGMLRQDTREGIRRTPANRGMRAHRIVKGLDISEDVCHGMCP